MNRSMLRVLAFRLAVVTATALAFCVIPGSAFTAASVTPARHPALHLRQLRFVPPSVNATNGSAKAALDWNITDTNRRANGISGQVDIRLEGSRPGEFIGRVYQVYYSLGTGAPQVLSSGTAQNSFYSYSFPVPSYSYARTAHWVVTRLTAADERGNKLSLDVAQLDSYRNVLKVRENIDATPPTYQSLELNPPGTLVPEPYVYDGGPAGGTMQYQLNALDQESGIWKGQLTLQGPQSKTLTAEFAVHDGVCGTGVASIDDTNVQCQVTVRFPHGTAAGTWSVSAISLWDNAGNKAVLANLNALPVVVTANAVLQAAGFTGTPNPFDNWVSDATVQVSMNVTGAVDGVTSITLDFGFGGCHQLSTTPVLNPDGTVSVPVDVSVAGRQCQLAGVAVLDGAGDLALYGSDFGAPDPGLTLNQIPDTTPPVVTSASLNPTTFSASGTPPTEVLTVTVTDAIAPVTDVSVTIFDDSGNPVGGVDGGVDPTVSGTLQIGLPLPELQPGTYTVAFQLTDAGGLSASYGYPNDPNSQAVPGGPLVLTVTS